MTSPEQRVELVKSESQRIQRYLEDLSDKDLTQTSACDAWEVGDVVAHLTSSVDSVSYTHLTLPTTPYV